MNEWREVQLGELVRCQSGFAFKSRDWSTSGVPVVKIRDVRSGVVRLDGVSFVASDAAAAAQRFLLRRGDVLITMSGEIGSVGVYRHDRSALLNQRVGRFELLNSSAADLNFLTFALQDPAQKHYFESVAYGVAQPNISPSLIGRARVRIPSLATQRRIAAVLSAFDELIELNERRIELLEGLVQSLYREWFVRFRFPGHEDVELVDSELGPIPEGWVVRPLVDLARSLADGDWIETKDQGGNDYRLLQVSNIGRGSFRETGKFRYISNETFVKLRCTAIEEGDLLISRMPDPIGRAWLVDQLVRPAVTAVDVAILRPLSSAAGAYLNVWLNSHATLARAEAAATGTTRKRISRSVLAQLKVQVPSTASLLAYEAATTPLRIHSTALRSIGTRLAATRDLLLPRLVTGRLDIADIDLGVLTPREVE